MNKLKRLLPSSHVHFYFLGLILVVLSCKTYWIVGLLILFLIYAKRLKIARYLYIFIGLCAIWVIVDQIKPVKTPKFGLVIQAQKRDDYQRCTVKYGFYNVHIYTNEALNVGEFIRINGIFKPYESDQFKGDFSPKDYYKSKFIQGVFYQPKITIINTVWTPYNIHADLVEHVDTLPPATQVFVKSLVLGVFESDYKTQIANVGISHLFVLSGLHVSVWILLLNVLLGFMPKKVRLSIQTGLLFGYLWVTLFPISLIRAVGQYLIFEWVNVNQKHYTRLDAFSFIGIGMLIWHPSFIFNIGFQLTFMVSFLFIVGDLKDQFIATLQAQTWVLPITTQIQTNLYPIAFVVTPFFIPLFTYLLLPLAWISLSRPMGEVLNPFFEFILKIILFLETDAIRIQLPKITGVFAVGYWWLWIHIQKQKTGMDKSIKIGLLVLYVMLFPNYKLLNPVGKVTFLSVGQGDTTIIERPHSTCTIIVDAFGDVVDYLKLNHIQMVDYLIITHGDTDHDRETNAIISQFDVKHLVLSTHHDASQYLTAQTHLKRVSAGDVLHCGDIELNILSPNRVYPSSNDASIVIHTTIGQTAYLLTGDIEYAAELALLNLQHMNLKADVLKVGHHGSKSSTNLAFLKAVSPKYAIISAGVDNHFGHPHTSVLNRLMAERVLIYQTNIHQTITFVEYPFYRRVVILVHKRG